jgi:hypothetical protein
MRSFILVVWLTIASPTACFAQAETVASWADRDTCAILFADDIPALYGRISKFPVFTSKYFEQAVELLTNDVSPVIHPTKWAYAVDKLEEVFGDGTSCEQLYVIVHEASLDDVKFSVIVKTNENTLDELGVSILSLVSVLRNLADEEEVALDSKLKNGFKALREIGFGNLTIRKVNEHIVLSNHPAKAELVVKRMEGEKVGRTLADARTFKLTKNLMIGKWGGDGLAYAYINPGGLRGFFPNIDDKLWAAYQVHELPGAAVQIAIRDENPIILVNGLVKFTEPAAGLAKQFEAYRVIENLPEFPYPILEFTAESKDFLEHSKATELLVDKIHGENAYKNSIAKQYENDSRDFFKDVVPRCKSRFTFLYRPVLNTDDSSQRQPRSRAVVLEEVSDHRAMTKFVMGIIELQNERRKGMEIEELDIDGREDFTIWAQSDRSLFKQYQKFNRKGKKSADEINFRTVRNTAFAVSSNWYLQGNLKEVLIMIRSLSDLGDQDQLEEVGVEIADLENELGFAAKSFKIRVDSAITYEDYVYKFVQRHTASRFPNYRVGREPPAGLTKMRREIRSGSYEVDLTDREDVIGHATYQMMKSALRTLDRRITLYSLDDASLQIAIAISGKAAEAKK